MINITNMKVDTELFGRLSNQEDAQLFTLQNSQGITVKLTNFGGTIISVLVPDRKGKLEDVVLGFDSLEDCLGPHPYINTLIGRYANRIANAKFNLDGKEYHLAQNAGTNHLHGGIKGYDKVLWNYSQYADHDRAGIMMSYLSFDMEEGYPGNLKVDVHFSLNESNELAIEYSAATDRNTYLNLTHHGYFNLNGAKNTIYDHEIQINASSYVETDKDLMPTGKIIKLKGGPLDFRKMKLIGPEIKKLESGFDHCYIIDRELDSPELAAVVYHPASGRKMEVYTTEPAIQFYSSNFLTGLRGKGNIKYRKHLALCLEAQHYPDSPNQPHFPSTLLKPDEIYRQTTIHKFWVE
jgi:aldose 1-epimerase